MDGFIYFMEDNLNDSRNNDGPGAIFDLSLADGDLLNLIKKPLTESEKYWNDTFKLSKVRSDNMNLWLPNHWQGIEVYDYQEENQYQDPRVFVSVETICSVCNARIAQPIVSPGQDSPTSVQLAQDVQKALYAHSKKFQTQDIFRISIRNLLLKRISWIKLRFDPSIGKHGEIIPEHVLPEDVVVDMHARWNDIPRFIAQRIRNKTIEELCQLFPDSEQKLYDLAGVKRRDKTGNLVAYKTQMAIKKDVWEVWFMYSDNGERGMGVAWVDENFQKVLGKMKDPNWNYDAKEESEANLFDQHEPPFIPINYLNDGTSYIDLTSMVEQAAPLQRIVNRRGFQMMENADQAGSGLVYNVMMIKKSDIEQLTGSPDERVGVKGDVRAAVARVAPPPLPSYVREDKLDARAEIADIFGTHDISRGQQSQNKTLGQDQMQVQQDYTRMDDISRAVERMATKYYRYLAQMMKVYYTEEHWFKADGEDGQFDFVMMKRDVIEDGIDIAVEAGSTMPMDKRAQTEFAANLAKMGMIDPLTLYEVGSGGPLPPPKKMLERFMAFKTDPMSFAGMAAKDEFDRNALMDIQILNAGKFPKLRDEIKPEYLTFFNNYMMTGDFQKQDDNVKGMYVVFLQQAQALAQQQLEQLQSQMPSPQEMDAANQKAVQDAGTQSAINQGQGPVPGGQPPAPGGKPPAGGPAKPPAGPQQAQPPQAPPPGAPPAAGGGRLQQQAIQQRLMPPAPAAVGM